VSELDLNGLRKRGHGLLLEEYSHCEVPAGCGGVILRWVRPGGPVDVDLRLQIDAEAQSLWIDGLVPERDRTSLPLGEHVLALHLVRPRGALLAWLQLERRQVERTRLMSSLDGSWRATPTRPGSGWTTPDFDDSAWSPLVASSSVKPADSRLAWRYDWLLREGAVPLAVDGSELWLRKVFRIDDGGLR